MLFLGSITAYRTFNIILNSGDFDSTGGYIYTEYETYSGLKYKSANRAVVVTTSSGGGGGTGGVYTALFESGGTPYGAVPLLPTKRDDIPGHISYEWIHGENSTEPWGTPFQIGRSGRVYESVNIVQVETLYGPLNNTVNYSYPFNIIINRPFLSVSRLTFTNEIQTSQYLTNGINAQELIGNEVIISGRDSETSENITFTYQWQKRVAQPTPFWDLNQYNNFKVNYEWVDIPNATNKNYTPPGLITKGTQYRRLVIDPNYPYVGRGSVSSNVIEIFPINLSDVSNNICCNQDIYSNQDVNIINGSNPSLQNVKYKWQMRNITYNSESPWTNIDGANENNYLPSKPRLGRQTLIKNEYRRILVSEDLIYYPSNSIIINFYSATNRISKNNFENVKTDIFNIYPNPVTTTLNVKKINDINFSDIKIIDLTGKIIYYSEKINTLNSNTFSINVSNLDKGLYSLIINTDKEQIQYKFVKE
ncbi:T9SS type A sorting domain-containing protein [Flavobacterium sp. NRK F7]|uniref:T9SS type A sorting domain-containing protein n=1 Tax=Flavobacterium sp. NRK F7 TaxID=2954930 RepID=UPI002090016E|nr:T9SS type A sorting domain-containing protein [Flavobacterium sp. NRK F7]MCO6163600.1 T9SS type A sorting domain-containing protein [Flavobacterium sp. NRK F7]